MAKIVLEDLSNIFTAATAINSNNAEIEAAIENTLSRDGTSPNEMNANLDMNNHRIYNLQDAVLLHEPVTLHQIEDILTGLDGLEEAVAAAQAAEVAAEAAQTAAENAEAGAVAAQEAAEQAAADIEGTLDTKLDLDAGNVVDASTVRGNLGLGNSATRNVGTTAGTVSAGDDSRITGAAQKGSNLSDLGSVATARTNLGLGNSATLNVGTAAGTVAAGDVVAAKFDKTGGTLTGNAVIAPASGTSALALRKASGTGGFASQIVGSVGGNSRWSLELGNSANEAGSNSGSDFALSRFTDANVYIDSPVTINRATGQGTLIGRWVFSRGAGSGGTFSPDFEQNVTEAFSAGAGFYIPFAILSNKTGGSGHREAVHVEQHSSSSGVGEFVVAIQGQGRITAGSGSAFGLNGYVWVDSGASSTVEAGAAEFNTDIRRAGGIIRKCGIQIVDVNTSVGAGTVIDAAVFIAKQAGGVGYNTGIQFGYSADAASFPLFAGGTLMSINGTIPALSAGINLGNLGATTAGAFVASPNTVGLSFGVSGQGGRVNSQTSSGGGQFIFGNAHSQVTTVFAALGYQSRSGTAGAFGGNYINFFWNSGTNKVDLYVDTNRIGSITTGA